MSFSDNPKFFKKTLVVRRKSDSLVVPLAQYAQRGGKKSKKYR
jgi:hypothetical protein